MLKTLTMRRRTHTVSHILFFCSFLIFFRIIPRDTKKITVSFPKQENNIKRNRVKGKWLPTHQAGKSSGRRTSEC